MREEDSEPFPDQPVADVVVPVAVRAQRRLGIVGMQRAQAVEADPVVEVGEQCVKTTVVGDVDAGHEEVARVEADAEPFVAPERVEDERELVERAADRSAGAGRVLHRSHVRSLQRSSTCSIAGTARSRPVVQTGTEMRADVEDDAVRLDRTGGVHRSRAWSSTLFS